MITYLVKRFLLMIPTLIGITLLVFAVSHAAPGDPVQASMGGSGMGGGMDSGGGKNDLDMQEQLERRRKELGLDKPIPVQYVSWVAGMAVGDFGKSTKYNAPVREKLLPALWITAKLNLISIILIYIIAIPLGIHAAVRRGKADERAAGVGLFALYSAPSFWVATLLLFYLCNPEWFYLFEGSGLESEGHDSMPYLDAKWDELRHYVLPVLCMTYGGLAGLSRFARAGMLEIIRADYIRTARAKGLSERVVILKHALRNSMIPIVTLMAGLLPSMIGGSVIIEFIFNINGMGLLGFEALLSRDYNMIMAIATLSAVLVLLGMLMSDVLYTLVDPRISLEG
ncbi:MAG: ABC transporter permease [Planctomycetes bacterium]|nr:ABC transporter permease [Planctomycetota bacterium]